MVPGHILLTCALSSRPLPPARLGGSSFLSRARFSAVPFPKSKWWQQPGMQSQQKGSRFACKGPTATPHSVPLFLIPGNPDRFPGVWGTLRQPTVTSSQSHTQPRFHMNQGQFLFAFLLFISKEKSILLHKRSFVLLRILVSIGVNLASRGLREFNFTA